MAEFTFDPTWPQMAELFQRELALDPRLADLVEMLHRREREFEAFMVNHLASIDPATPKPTDRLTTGSGTGATTFTTASISPTANYLVLAAVVTRAFGASAPIPTLTGCAMKWEVAGTETFTNHFGNECRLTVFRSLSPQPLSSPVEIAHTGGAVDCQWIFDQFANVNTTGHWGENAITQAVTATAEDTDTISVPLITAEGPDNRPYGAFFGFDTTQLWSIEPGPNFIALGQHMGTQVLYSDAARTPVVAELNVNEIADIMGVALEIRSGTTPFVDLTAGWDDLYPELTWTSASVAPGATLTAEVPWNVRALCSHLRVELSDPFAQVELRLLRQEDTSTEAAMMKNLVFRAIDVGHGFMREGGALFDYEDEDGGINLHVWLKNTGDVATTVTLKLNSRVPQ